MRVGAVVAGFDPRSGGGHTFEREILNALTTKARESEHQFTVLCPADVESDLREAVAGAGMNVAAIQRPRNRVAAMVLRELEIARAHWRSPSALDRVAAAHGIQFIWFLSASQQRTDLPYMTVVWDLLHRATPWFPEMSAGGVWDQRDAAHRWFLQRATAVITGTETGAAEINAFFQVPRAHILVLPHPTPVFAAASEAVADEIRLAEGRRVRSKFGLDKPFVLYPAQFWAHKNHVNLVLAIAILRRRGLDVQVALPGSNNGNRAHVMNVANQEGVADLVHPLGFVDRSDLLALYREALALAYVSWCGPENLPPLEAFALGCPVIASDIPGADEQLGDAALMCDPGSPVSIGLAIERVASEPVERRRLIDAGRKRSTRFSPHDFVDGVFGFLDSFEAIRRCWA